MAHDINSIYEEIKEDIISLNILPGTKIKEEDLAARFNISRTPIRSVIAQLVKDKLLEVVPVRGTYVTKIDINNINDYLYIRKSVEVNIVRTIANICTEENLNELRDILKEQKEISNMEPSIDKSNRFYLNDNKFHMTLYKIAHLENVWYLLYENSTPLNRARIISNLRETNNVQKVYEQHYAVYENLRIHNTEKAVEAMEKHLDEGFDGVSEVIKEYKDYFIEG